MSLGLGLGFKLKGYKLGLAIPKNLRITSTTATTISYAWDAVPGVDGYRLQISKVSDFSSIWSDIDISGNSNTTYTFIIRAGSGFYARVEAYSSPKLIPKGSILDVQGNNFTVGVAKGYANSVFNIDVFKSDGITYVAGYNNVSFNTLTYIVNSGIGGLQTYKIRIRSILNEVILPALPTSWDVVVPVTTTIQAALDYVTAQGDASATKRYCIQLASHGDYNEKALWTIPYCDIDLNYSRVHYEHNVGLLQDTIIWGANCNIFNGILDRTCTAADGDSNYAVHIHSTGGQMIMYNVQLNALGDLSKDAAGADLYDCNCWLINCDLYSQVLDGTNFHTLAGATNPSRMFLINTNITCGDSTKVALRWGIQKTLCGDKDLIYVDGGNIPKILLANSGSPVANGNESKIYISSRTVWNGDRSSWVSNYAELDSTTVKTFISDSGVFVTDYSDMVSVTTLSQGTLPLDNIGSAYVALSLRRLLTSYTGNLIRLRRSTDNIEKDFGYNSSNLLDTSAITAWLSSATGYVTRWYMQDGSALYVSQSDTTKQLVFIADRGDGKPSLNQNGSVRTLTGTLVNPALQDIALIIAGALDNYSSFGTGYGWSEGINLFAYFNANGIVINSTTGSIRFNSQVAFDRVQKVFGLLYKPTTIKTYENSISKIAMSGTYGQLNTPTGYNIINIGMSEASWSSSNSKFNEVIMLNSQINETDMLTVDTNAQYWN